MDRMNPDYQARIEALENLVAGLEKRVGQVIATSQNISFVNDSTTSPTGPTNSMSLGIMSVATQVKGSGKFQAAVNIPYGSGTNGDSLIFTLQLFTGTGALTYTRGTQVANKGDVQVSNAAGGLAIATGGGTSVNANFYSATFPMLTGVLAGDFSWAGLVTDSSGAAGNDAAFPVGNNVILLVAVSAAHSSTMTFTNPSISLYELPFSTQ